ncbi:MAG TPA: DUF4838 domain-containing protein [Bacteroidales bacterium]|nr:DUF4838 domain-containing protein [Bacteroidales bacterium]
MNISEKSTFRSSLFLRSLLIVLSFILVTIQPVSSQKRKVKKVEPVPAVNNLVVADRGESRYRIIIPAYATPAEVKAAEVLQDHLLQISEAALPVISVNKNGKGSPYEIILGQNERLDKLGIEINFNELGEDGFIIKTDSLRLIIAGGSKKGTLYGVYTFLEKYLGCRMYAPGVKIIPQKERIEVGILNDKEVPAIKYRTIHYKVTWDQEYADWHKLSHDADGERSAWGLWVHTFNHLVPPEIYFKEHPEYYALRDGRRIPTQLCLTNPEVLKITIQNLRKDMARNPEALYWSVSQNDNRNYCMCENCQALDKKEGSPSGSIIWFVNQVADQFPDKVISTLAYEYGRKAPLTLRPRDNVNIMLCSIEMRRDRPFAEATDETSLAFVRDVRDWSKIAKDIIVWDYVIQFSNLISPFPNLHVLQPNLKFFVENGVTAMFEQGNREVGGEFAELRSYMISKLLWDPEADADAIMNDFLNGYYGAGGKFIRYYIDEMREAVLRSDRPLSIFGSPNAASVTYLTPPLIDRYTELFNQAESVVADSAVLLERVRIARLPLNFAILEQAKKNFTGDRGVFINTGEKWEVRPQIRSMIDPFVDLCIRQGVTKVKEWNTTPEAYRSAMYRLFFQGRNEHLAFGKPVQFLSPEITLIREDERGMLTDGIRGSHDTEYGWLDFAGKDLDVVIDLGETKKVQHIECAFYQLAMWLSIAPAKVDFLVSADGKNFELTGSVTNSLPIDQYDSFQRDFIVDFEPRDARYVRVVAHNIGNTPESHPGTGQPARLHIDEIVVE